MFEILDTMNVQFCVGHRNSEDVMESTRTIFPAKNMPKSQFITVHGEPARIAPALREYVDDESGHSTYLQAADMNILACIIVERRSQAQAH